MSLHIFTALKQPLTRYRDPHLGRWIRTRTDKIFRCHACGRRRWAKNLTVQVYYDMVVIACRGECWPGQRAGRRRPKGWRR